jgi:carbonic anhydrase
MKLSSNRVSFKLILAIASLTAGNFAAAAEAAHHWGYSGEGGPEHWAAMEDSFATCGVGKHQSPIDLNSAVTKDLPPIQFSYQALPLTVTDTGHSFQVNAAAGSGGITVGADHYDLVQFHFHRPSEETMQGRHYSMVAHLVHKNAKGDLAVVAVLIRKGETNKLLKSVFDNFPAQGKQESSVAGATINLNEFIPQQHGYFTFEGSLTTPPCSEGVRWFVLKSPVDASAEQIKQFASRYPHNARPTQPLNGRVVEETKE